MPRLRTHHCRETGCSKSFVSDFALIGHVRIHTGERPFVCDIDDCGQTFVQKAHLNTHKSVHSDDRPYHCPFEACDVSFKLKNNLAVHLLVHSEYKDYICPQNDCDKAFKTRRDLATHIERVHDKIRRFSCEQCPATFYDRSTFNDHMNIHTGNRPYKCLVKGCIMAFAHSNGLRCHMLVHSDDRPFGCIVDGCVKTYKQKEHLEQHMLTHTGERPFKCDRPSCGASFAYRNVLTMHLATHDDVRPFACTQEGCDQAFRRKHHLENHLRWHSGEKPFECDEDGCGSTFTQEAHLAAHMQVYHTEKGQQIRKKKEHAVAKALDAAKIDYKREHQINFSCFENTYAKTDFIITATGGILIVEIDESQHQSYGVVCDVARMSKIITALLMSGNTLPIGIIRYNPDGYTIDGKKQRKTQKIREQQLVKVINNWQFGEPGSLEIQYMFYDCDTVDDEQLALKIWEDPLYDTIMTQCCRPPIV